MTRQITLPAQTLGGAPFSLPRQPNPYRIRSICFDVAVPGGAAGAPTVAVSINWAGVANALVIVSAPISPTFTARLTWSPDIDTRQIGGFSGTNEYQTIRIPSAPITEQMTVGISEDGDAGNPSVTGEISVLIEDLPPE